MLWIVSLSSILIILPANVHLQESYRLPTGVTPEKYSITLEPDFDTFNFTGIVEIKVQIVENTSSITLHSVGHTLQNLSINCSSQTEDYPNLTIDSINRNVTKQFLILGLSQNILSGSECTLRIEYEGILGEDNDGFYRVQYRDEEGNTRWFAVTQFEPTYARKAFPCFDEPALKAEFEMTVIRPRNYNSISNTPKNFSGDYSDTKQIDRFLVSPIMSTYLVAVIVSEYTNVSSGYQSVYARPELIDDGRADFALSVGLDVLPVMEDFVGIPYNSSLSKLGNAAIPDGYFRYGGMENWGLITYRETNLLSKQNVSMTFELLIIITILSHEYGHSWFGNLVSPQWWNYLWLSEAFAQYFQYYAGSVALPSWRLMERFALAEVQVAFGVDQLQNTHPMTFDAQTPDQIAALIDRITYSKAASVIRMLEHFLTTPVFRKGLNKYLENNSYSAATEYDLWDALEEAVVESGTDLEVTVEEIMVTWTQQAGFPLVTVQVDNITGTVTFAQERFITDNSSYNSNETWIIPISFAVSSNPNFTNTSTKFLLRQTVQTVSVIDNLNPDEWIIINVQQTGYYRVNYDSQNWRLIINYLNSDNFINIHPSNRAQLIDDAYALANNERLDYGVFLDLLSYLRRETDYVPIYPYYDISAFLNRVLSASPNITLFREFAQGLLQNAIDSLTLFESSDDGPIDRLNRRQILIILCNLNDEAVLQYGNDVLRTWQNVSPDLQAPVYCGGLKKGGEEEWNHLYNLYISNTTEMLQKNRILIAISCSENTTLLQRVLDMALNRSTEWSFLSDADRLSAISDFYSNSDTAIDIMLNMNFSLLFQSFSVNDVNTILDGLSRRLTRSDRQDLFRRTLEQQDSSTWSLYGSAFNNSLTNLDQLNEWNDKYQDTINNWLVQNVNISSTSGLLTTLQE